MIFYLIENFGQNDDLSFYKHSLIKNNWNNNDVYYNEFYSLDEFQNSIISFNAHTFDEDVLKILVISAHGCTTHVDFSFGNRNGNNESISFNTIVDILRQISHNNVIIFIDACFGAFPTLMRLYGITDNEPNFIFGPLIDATTKELDFAENEIISTLISNNDLGYEDLFPIIDRINTWGRDNVIWKECIDICTIKNFDYYRMIYRNSNGKVCRYPDISIYYRRIQRVQI